MVQNWGQSPSSRCMGKVKPRLEIAHLCPHRWRGIQSFSEVYLPLVLEYFILIFLVLHRDDASFSVSVPSGSYVVEVSNPTVYYEPVRVDVNSKGKFRARKINHVQPSAVSQMTYPLKFKPGMPYRYFQQREQWRVTDLLFSPMVCGIVILPWTVLITLYRQVLMMFLPLVLIFILPKMMNDPETRKVIIKFHWPTLSVTINTFCPSQEMENIQMPKYEMPEMSEMLTSLFGGGDAKKAVKSGSSKGVAKRKT